MIGHFVHKYQLLYAMEHRQHSTGRGWMMMCNRVILGALLFQLTLAGQLALRKAFKRAALIAPLTIATLWFAYRYSQTYSPLMKFLALRSLRRAEHSDLGRAVQEDAVVSGRGDGHASASWQTLDEARENGMRFEPPSLVMP
jgi:calcium permeable stress-gated cation channel